MGPFYKALVALFHNANFVKDKERLQNCADLSGLKTQDDYIKDRILDWVQWGENAIKNMVRTMMRFENALWIR